MGDDCGGRRRVPRNDYAPEKTPGPVLRVTGSGQEAPEVVSEQADRLSVDLADPRLG